ncbi:dipeptide epimerase [Oleiharenicola lentus]|uniref:dipeptide epimerase n=1 Tax=Oleiharenicola lentus TaxID=2508720 RepID=UPI003F6697D7
MSSPTSIRAVEISTLDIPLHTPFGISGGAQAMANNVLVSVTLANGQIGYGEAAPLPPYNGETQADALRTLNNFKPKLIGREVNDWRAFAEEIRAWGGATCGSAQCAIEMAIVDALAKSQGVPLWKFFGGFGTELETDMTVTTGTAAQAAEDARAIRARGIRTIKVKVGGAKGAGHDLERIRAIHAAAPDSPLILDGNAGVSRAHASELVRGIRDAGIKPALLEQWLAKEDLAGARELREESGWAVAADETACSGADVTRIADERAADFVNIKLMKAGLSTALEIVKVAKERNIGLMIGGNVESILAMTVSACLAAGQGGFTFADLDTPWFMSENPFEGGFIATGGNLSVAHLKSGHGVTPKQSNR